jgi:hypothetical protein
MMGTDFKFSVLYVIGCDQFTSWCGKYLLASSCEFYFAC